MAPMPSDLHFAGLLYVKNSGEEKSPTLFILHVVYQARALYLKLVSDINTDAFFTCFLKISCKKRIL